MDDRSTAFAFSDTWQSRGLVRSGLNKPDVRADEAWERFLRNVFPNYRKYAGAFSLRTIVSVANPGLQCGFGP